MKKSILCLTAALVAGLLFTACAPASNPDTGENYTSLSDVFQNLVIPDEQLYQKSGSSRTAANRENLSFDATVSNPSPYNGWWMSTESRGSIFLYLLKYDFTKLNEFKTSGSVFDFTVDFSNKTVSNETKEFILKTQGQLVLDMLSYNEASPSPSFLGFGTCKFTGTLSNIICKQTQSAGSYVFNHYITMSQNSNGYYDITFYAYEALPNGQGVVTPTSYFEKTKTNGSSNFEVDFWEVSPSAITSIDNLANTGITNHRNLKFSSNVLKKYAINGSYAYYGYGDYTNRTAVVKDNNYYDYGYINSNNMSETVRKTGINTSDDKYNVLWVNNKTNVTMIRPSNDSYTGGLDYKKFSTSESNASSCPWKLNQDSLADTTPVYCKTDIRNNGSFFEKAWYVDFNDTTTSANFTKDTTPNLDFDSMKTKVDEIVSTKVDTATYTTAEIAGIVLALNTIIPSN